MKNRSTQKSKMASTQAFPPGWDAKRVKEVINYYNRQTEEEALAEYEAAMKLNDKSVLLVPTELVPEIRRLIARRRGA